MSKRIINSLSLVLCVGLIAGVFIFGSEGTFPSKSGQQAGVNATVEPTLIGTAVLTAFKVTVTKVELWNGTAWVVIFSGSSELDLVQQEYGSPAKIQNGYVPATFPGIQDLAIPGGTYSQLRVTFLNSFYVEGDYSTLDVLYRTTTTTLYDDTAILGAEILLNVVTGNGASVKNPNWGALGDPVVQLFQITPFTVDSNTDYQPTIKFDASNSLKLYSIPEIGGGTTYFFSLDPPDVSLY